MAIDKSLSFVLCPATYYNQILRIHILVLSLVILVTAKIYFFHLYRRLLRLFINKIPKKSDKTEDLRLRK